MAELFPSTPGAAQSSEIEHIPITAPPAEMPQELIPLEAPNTLPTMPWQMATKRAQEYSFAMGDMSPTVEELTSSLERGDEGAVREEYARRKDAQARAVQLGILNEIVTMPGADPMNPEYQGLVNAMTYDSSRVFDPDTVLEEDYAQQLSTTMIASSTLPMWEEYISEDTDNALDKVDMFSEIIAMRKSAERMKEDMANRWKDMTTLDKGWNWFEQIVPFKSWANMNNRIRNAPTSGLLPGDNLQEQYQYLWSLPLPLFQKNLKQAVEKIAENNVLDAMSFLDGALSYSTADAFIDNALTAIDVIDLGLGVGLGAAAGKGIRAITRSGRVRPTVPPGSRAATPGGRVAGAPQQFGPPEAFGPPAPPAAPGTPPARPSARPGDVQAEITRELGEGMGTVPIDRSPPPAPGAGFTDADLRARGELPEEPPGFMEEASNLTNMRITSSRDPVTMRGSLSQGPTEMLQIPEGGIGASPEDLAAAQAAANRIASKTITPIKQVIHPEAKPFEQKYKVPTEETPPPSKEPYSPAYIIDDLTGNPIDYAQEPQSFDTKNFVVGFTSKKNSDYDPMKFVFGRRKGGKGVVYADDGTSADEFGPDFLVTHINDYPERDLIESGAGVGGLYFEELEEGKALFKLDPKKNISKGLKATLDKLVTDMKTRKPEKSKAFPTAVVPYFNPKTGERYIITSARLKNSDNSQFDDEIFKGETVLTQVFNVNPDNSVGKVVYKLYNDQAYLADTASISRHIKKPEVAPTPAAAPTKEVFGPPEASKTYYQDKNKQLIKQAAEKAKKEAAEKADNDLLESLYTPTAPDIKDIRYPKPFDSDKMKELKGQPLQRAILYKMAHENGLIRTVEDAALQGMSVRQTTQALRNKFPNLKVALNRKDTLAATRADEFNQGRIVTKMGERDLIADDMVEAVRVRLDIPIELDPEKASKNARDPAKWRKAKLEERKANGKRVERLNDKFEGTPVVTFYPTVKPSQQAVATVNTQNITQSTSVRPPDLGTKRMAPKAMVNPVERGAYDAYEKFGTRADIEGVKEETPFTYEGVPYIRETTMDGVRIIRQKDNKVVKVYTPEELSDVGARIAEASRTPTITGTPGHSVPSPMAASSLPRIQDETFNSAQMAIKDAYVEMAKNVKDREFGYIDISELRKKVFMSKEKFNTELKELYRQGKVRLTLYEDQKNITPAQREGALDVGAQPMHLVTFDTRDVIRPVDPTAPVNPISLPPDPPIDAALKSVLRDPNTISTDVESVAAAAGDLETAARAGAVEFAQSLSGASDAAREGRKLFKEIPSLFNFKAIMEDTSSVLSTTRKQSLVNHMQRNARLIKDLVLNLNAVNRLTPEALEIGIREATESLSQSYGSMKNAFLDVTYGGAFQVQRPWESRSNTATVYLRMGKQDGTLFPDAKKAVWTAKNIYRLSTNQYKVRPHGAGFMLEIGQAVDETSPNVLAALKTVDNTTPITLLDYFIGGVRTTDSIVSLFHNQNRKIATFGPQVIETTMQELAKPFTALGKSWLSKRESQKLERFLIHNRDIEYRDTDGVLRRGKFFETPGQFEIEWQQMHNTLPSEKVRKAYFTYVQLNDFDYILRNLAIYRDKVTQGIESFRMRIPSMTKDGTLITTDSKNFDAKLIQKMPWDAKEDAGIWINDPSTQVSRYVRKNRLSQADRDYYDAQGYQVIQLADPEGGQFSKIAGTEDTINFILTKDATRGKIDWKQLPRRPGGHVDYAAPFFVKQPKIKRLDREGTRVHKYEGDVSILNVETAAEAKKYAEAIDKGREIVKGGPAKLNELIDHLSDNLPFWTADEFTAFFRETVDAATGEITPAKLNIDDKIQFTRTGDNLGSTYNDLGTRYSNFEDGANSNWNLYRNIDKKFAGARDTDLPSVKEKGSEANPLHELIKPRLIDPYTTMKQALHNAIGNRFYSDYKKYAVNSFFQEFGDMFTIPKEELMKDSLKYFYDPPFNMTSADPIRRKRAERVRQAIINLMGTYSDTEAASRWMQDKLASSIYGALGQKSSNWVSEKMLPMTTDPTKYARGVAFQTKMGFFNYVQMWKNAHTLTHMFSLSPLQTAQGAVLAVGDRAAMSVESGVIGQLMNFLSLTGKDNIIEHFSKFAPIVGWKPAEFLESYRAMKSSGWNLVEGEHAWVDNVGNPKMFRGTVHKGLDKGTFFFKESERFLRMTAWNIAYKEWKNENPGKAMTGFDEGAILNRADLLSNNMSRASNSQLQNTKIGSMGLQFLGYQMRLMDQLLGKRITRGERIRAGLIYSAMYGIPVGVGGAFLGAYPWYEDIRMEMLERGVPMENTFVKALNEGLVSVAMTLMTGESYNFSETYGPGGITLFKEALHGDKTIMELVTGAAGTVIGDILESADPALKWIKSVVTDDDVDLTMEDFMDVARNISTVNNLTKAYLFANTSKFITQKEIHIGGVNDMDAFMMGMFGMANRKITDPFEMSKTIKGREEGQKFAEEKAIQYLRRAIMNHEDNNQFSANMKKMKVYLIAGGFTPDERAAILRKAAEGHNDITAKIKFKFSMQEVPTSQQAAREQAIYGDKR